MFKRTISLLLLTSMLAALASCGSSESDGKTDNTSSDIGNDTTAEETDDTPKLGIEKEDNGGRTFTMLVPTHASYEYDVEQTDDIVDDAVYNRNSAVEELLGISFRQAV